MKGCALLKVQLQQAFGGFLYPIYGGSLYPSPLSFLISVRNSVGVEDSNDFPSWPIVLPLIIEHHLSENQQVISTWPTPILSSQFQTTAD